MCKLQDNAGWEQMIILSFYLLHWAQTLSVLCPGPFLLKNYSLLVRMTEDMTDIFFKVNQISP